MAGFNDLYKNKQTTQQQPSGGFNKLYGGMPQQGTLQAPEMRTPQQMEEQMTTNQELPPGAISMNPDGTPNYGSGIQGWWNGITSRITAPVVDNGTETQPGVTDIAGRVLGEGFNQIINVVSAPQQWYYGYLADRRTYEMYADMVNPNMPDIFQDNELGNFLRITSSLIPGISNLTTMYEKDRIKNGNRLLPDGTFEKIQEANRIWNKENVGTAIFDTQIQSEYIRRVLAGEDPYKLTKEWAKPVENFITDFLLDPLNVFDGLGIATKVLGTSNKLIKGVLVVDELKDTAKALEELSLGTKALDAVSTARNAVTTDNLIETVVKVFSGRNQKAIDNAKTIATSLSELTQDSKRVLLKDKLTGVMVPLMKFARGDMALYDKFLNAIRQLGSEDLEIAKEGAKFLQENKILHLFLSDNAMEASRFMNKMYENTKNLKTLEKAVTEADQTKFFTEFSNIAEKVFKEIYPDANDVADGLDAIKKFRLDNPDIVDLPKELQKFEGFTMSETARWIARTHKSMQENFLGTKIGMKNANEFFSLIYLTSPGFAARNYMNAAAQAFIDFGPSGLRQMVDLVGSQKYIEDMFGLVPGSISKAFSANAAVKGAKEAQGIMKPFAWMRALAGKGEEYESMAIAAAAGKRYSNEMLREMKFIEGMDTLRQVGFSNSALKHLESLVRKYNGQTDKALAEFSNMFKKGAIEHFREPEMIFNEQIITELNGLNEHYLDDIREIMKTGTLDDVLSKMDNYFEELVKKSQNNVDTVSAAYDAEETQDMIKMATDIAKNGEEIPDEAMNKIVDAVVGKVDEVGNFSGSTEELAQIAEETGQFAESTSKAIKQLIGNNGLTLNQVDLFAKKQSVRVHLFEGIKNVARDVLSGAKRDEFSAKTAQRTSEIFNIKTKLSEDVRQIIADVRNGRISMSDLVTKLSDEAKYPRISEFIPEIKKSTNAADVPSMLWDYYHGYVSALYTESIDEAYKLLDSMVVRKGFGAIGNVSNAKMTMLDQQFDILYKYLNADKIINGKVYINEPYYWYKRGDLVKSVVARGKQLGLFASEIQFKGDKQLHRATIWQVVKKELERIGVGGGIGNIMDENNYRLIMHDLDNYAVQRNKLLAMRDAVNDAVKPFSEIRKRLLDLKIQTPNQKKEIGELTRQINNFNSMKSLISKKLSKGDVQDIEQFTTDFVGWFNESTQTDSDILRVIVEASLQNVKTLPNVPDQDATVIAEIVSKLLSEQPEIVREAQDAQKVLNEAKKIAKAKIGTTETKVITSTEDQLAQASKKISELDKEFESLSNKLDINNERLKKIDKEIHSKSMINNIDTKQPIRETKKYNIIQSGMFGFRSLPGFSEVNNIFPVEKWNIDTASKEFTENELYDFLVDLEKNNAKDTELYKYIAEKHKEISTSNTKIWNKSRKKFQELSDESKKLLEENKLIENRQIEISKNLFDLSQINENKLVYKEDQLAQAAADAITKSVDDTKKAAEQVAESMQKAADETPKTKPEDMLTSLNETPDLNDGNMKTPQQAMAANMSGVKQLFDAMKSSISGAYGKSELVSSLKPEQLDSLSKWAGRNEVKMLDFRTRMLEYMKQTRDFALLDYAGGKRNIDLAMAYIFPYQFWYSRTYGNWIKRLVSNPAIMSRYVKYRNFLEEQNKNLPEYMRNNIVLGKSIGMKDNPLMLNLEASFNPLNGITGIDFTDKNKIVGTPGTLEYAMTKTMDAIGKYGPSPWSPYTMMMAAYLANKGEKEAAARWAGRLFPQSMPIKAIASLFGQNIELDPFVMLFGDGSGTDPYESRRVGRALIAMSEAGQITKEQAYEAARQKSGEVWDRAVVQATKNRALGTISAYVLGQGFKVRSQADAQVDKFYEEYFKMWANADKFTPDEMSNYQRYIRTKYDFADLVILSGKGSAERDKAYAYSVLSRIAPGQTGDIMKALGVNPNLSDLFYQSKGDMSNWNALDKESFMNAMVQIGTLVAIPNDTTIEQWQMVKTIYKQADRELVNRFGEDIINKIETFYEFTYDSQEQKNYMEAHPEVQQALDYKDYLIGSNKDIAPYYDGLMRMERYYNGEFRRQVALQIDPNYYEYYKIRSMIIDPAQLKQFEREVGWSAMSKKYNAFKKQWDMEVWKKLDQYDKYFLAEPIPTQFQNTTDVSVGQQAIKDLLAPAQQDQRQMTWQQITSAIPMPITLEKAIQQYVTTDRQLTGAESTMVGKLLNNVNYMYGLNLTKEDLLSLAMDYYQ